jgi:hypothetical protein
MLKRLILILSILIPMFTFAQSGKIVGRVTDAQTGEPLIGANIVIEGTYSGAATDIEGEYLILNIPPGTYIVKAMYVGYQDMILENIFISVGLTKEINFQLKSGTFEAEAITIIAERPLINKNITNSTSIVSAEDIENLPVREVNNIVAKQAGVVQQGGNLHIRGSRSDGVAYYIDGVLVNDPVFGNATTSIITNAIEEIQFQAGGYPAEYGGANGGIISTHSRTGSDKYKLSAEVITDHFVDTGEKFLGTYSYGYSEYTLTAGGLVIPSKKDLRFFIAANNRYQRSPAKFYNGYNFEGLYEPALDSSEPFDVYYPDGYNVSNGQNQYKVQGNLTWNLKPVNLRLNATHRHNEGHTGVGLQNYESRTRTGLTQEHAFTTSLKLTHAVNQNCFYDVILSYFNNLYIRMDPIFKHNTSVYGDSIENAAVGTQMAADGTYMIQNSAYTFSFRPGSIPYNAYEKQNYQSFGGKINLVYQLGKHHELKTGGELSYFITRYYFVGPRAVAGNVKAVCDGNPYDIYARVNNYGYDVNGNKTDSGLEKPRNPIFGGAFIQDKMEFSDLIINAGIRLDYIDIDDKTFKNPHNVQFADDGRVDQNFLIDVEPTVMISPRLGFSFPVSERTIFHAQYGKFVQQSRLRDVFQGYNVITDNIKGGFAIQNPVGFGLEPEKTTLYEIGFKQQIGEHFAFDITGFYKDIKDQVQIRSIYAEMDASHNQYYAWVNGDFATTKGVEIKLDLRRTHRVAASFDYTYSNALGTGSNPSGGFRAIWQSPTATPYFPEQIAPLTFNQTHRGNLNLDYRFSEDDGPSVFGAKALQNFGLNLYLTFNSGYNYTRWDGYGNAHIPLEPLNSSSTPWVYQTDIRIDKSFKLGSFKANVYVWIDNLFNRKNVIAVFPNTGDPENDGYLSTADGETQTQVYAAYGEEHAELYRQLYTAINYNPDNFGPPRQIRLGLKIDF